MQMILASSDHREHQRLDAERSRIIVNLPVIDPLHTLLMAIISIYRADVWPVRTVERSVPPQPSEPCKRAPMPNNRSLKFSHQQRATLQEKEKTKNKNTLRNFKFRFNGFYALRMITQQ